MTPMVQLLHYVLLLLDQVQISMIYHNHVELVQEQKQVYLVDHVIFVVLHQMFDHYRLQQQDIVL
jgi:hypothetical protein